MKASVDFDLWLKGMEMVGVSIKTHYHPLLQIAVKMREEIEQRDAVIEASKKVISTYDKDSIPFPVAIKMLRAALSQLEMGQ